MNQHFRPTRSEAFALDLSETFIRRTDLSEANLRHADLSKADCTRAIFRGADFEGAILEGTILKGADLSNARNLTVEQISKAVIDKDTILPAYLR